MKNSFSNNHIRKRLLAFEIKIMIKVKKKTQHKPTHQAFYEGLKFIKCKLM